MTVVPNCAFSDSGSHKRSLDSKLNVKSFLNFYNLCEQNNTDICEVKANQCGIKFPEFEFGTAHDKNKEFIGNIAYLGCDEVKSMYNTKGVNHKVANNMVMGIVSGIAAIILLLAIIAMITVTVDVHRELKGLGAR